VGRFQLMSRGAALRWPARSTQPSSLAGPQMAHVCPDTVTASVTNVTGGARTDGVGEDHRATWRGARAHQTARQWWGGSGGKGEKWEGVRQCNAWRRAWRPALAQNRWRLAAWAGEERGRGSGRVDRYGWARVDRPKMNSDIFHLIQIFKLTQICNGSKQSFFAWKIPNKICIWREWNKEQLFLLELFKIWDRIWIKKQGCSRVWNSIEFDWNFQNWWILNKELRFALG
jgi:hypothetical protein